MAKYIRTNSFDNVHNQIITETVSTSPEPKGPEFEAKIPKWTMKEDR